MRLTILYKPGCGDRPWLIKREGGAYEQHAHLHTKKDALRVRQIIDAGKYPYCKEYKVAVQQLLTEEEFKRLHKSRDTSTHKKGRGSITPVCNLKGLRIDLRASEKFVMDI